MFYLVLKTKLHEADSNFYSIVDSSIQKFDVAAPLEWIESTEYNFDNTEISNYGVSVDTLSIERVVPEPTITSKSVEFLEVSIIN